MQVNPQTLPMACGYREVGLGYQIGFRNDQTEIEKLTEIFFEQQRQNNPKYVLLFQNVGRGETFNAVVDKFVVKDKYERYRKNNPRLENKSDWTKAYLNRETTKFATCGRTRDQYNHIKKVAKYLHGKS